MLTRPSFLGAVVVVPLGALAAWLGEPSGTLEIRPAADGAPEALLDGRPLPAVFSLTHREGCAGCAVAPPP